MARRKKPTRPPRRLPGGFISLERRVFSEDMRGDGPLILIWGTLIAWANPVDGKERLGGQQVIVRRGQLVTGLDELADEWGLGIKIVRRCLEYLRKSDRIGMRTGNHGTIITINKYDFYQSAENSRARKRASEGQTEGKRRASNGQHQNQVTTEPSNLSFSGDSPPPAGGKKRKGLSPTAIARAAVAKAAAEAQRQNASALPWSATEAQAALGDSWPLFVRRHPHWEAFATVYLRQAGRGYGGKFEAETVGDLRALLQADGNRPPDDDGGSPPPDESPPGFEPYQN